MSPAGAGEFIREVQPGGLEVDGEFFPEGVQLGSSNWSLNYNEEIFLDALVYRPERWIVDEKTAVTAEQVARAHSSFHPFSAGPDSCIGKNLALMELMITIGKTLYRMDVRALPGDMLGGGAPELGWGRRNRNQYQLRDAYISLRDGPMVQFRKCGLRED